MPFFEQEEGQQGVPRVLLHVRAQEQEGLDEVLVNGILVDTQLSGYLLVAEAFDPKILSLPDEIERDRFVGFDKQFGGLR